MSESVSPPSWRLTTPVDQLPGVGDRRARLLGRLGIGTVSDLVRHLPMRYEHESAEEGIANLAVGSIGSARGVVAAVRWVPARGGGRARKGRFEATLEDATGRLAMVWFNGGRLRHRLHAAMTIRVQGKVKRYGPYKQMVNPHWEPMEDLEATPAKAERLRPVYPATEDLPSSMIERLIDEVLPHVLEGMPDPLPEALRVHHGMLPLAEALRIIHHPESREQAATARRRLAFNELLLLQLGVALKRAYVENQLTAPALRHNQAIDEHIRGRFPFELTEAQQRVMAQIAGDLTGERPMNRLLQGDVGSGKTVVALYALLLAVADRRQAILMAPTELLAEQHLLSIGRLLRGSPVRIALLTGTQPAASGEAREALLAQIAGGEIDLVVGTHALLAQRVGFHDLAVAVIDEQHRFGVQQRAEFRTPRSRGRAPHAEPATGSGDRAGDGPAEPPDPPWPGGNRSSPHHLVMTATPIPRTLSLTLFGDLDVSTIDELPPGRTPVATRVVGPDRSDEVYRYLGRRLERGEQAYVVVPAIDSESQESEARFKSVRTHAKLLQDKYCRGYRVATIHGRMKRSTRERIMDRFRGGKIHVLVATTVIEVGVDVPNASVMVVEHAERFGLAQLHQLRGRVGRASDGRRSLAVFVGEPTTEEGRRRLEAIGSTHDGFRIAEMDLEIRGMGDFFGTRQSGMPPLRVARVPEDMDLLQLARRDAQQLVARDPDLQREEHQALRQVLLAQYGEALGLVDVG